MARPRGFTQAAVSRRATNVTLSEPLLREDDKMASAKAKQWQAENRVAMDAWNDYVEQNGLPLAEFRQF